MYCKELLSITRRATVLGLKEFILLVQLLTGEMWVYYWRNVGVLLGTPLPNPSGIKGVMCCVFQLLFQITDGV